LGYPGDVKAESNGFILVSDQSNHNISEYTEAGAATGISIATPASDYVQEFALIKAGNTIGAADSLQLRGEIFSFPGGQVGKVFHNDPNVGYPIGFAFDPPAKK
jgi:hypothetical protein